MKIALGMMIRSFKSPEPVLTFLKNAEKYGHKINRVIVAYSNETDGESDAVIEKETGVPVTLVKINRARDAEDRFDEMGISQRTKEKLLHSSVVGISGLVPYGFNRNNVLIEALLGGNDILFYIDDDVAPYVLKKKGVQIYEEEIDFFGRHLAEIEKGARFTTSDYSGFNILPYAHFDGMEELLVGLQKDAMLEFWKHSEEHHCLYVQHNSEPVPMGTHKVLGGNLAVDLRNKKELLPFFSPHYELDGKVYLARGEDTLIANLAEEAQISCVDIDMYIFHNTYGDYPEIPDLKTKEKTQERFFYACTGWIGRNPFMNYLQGSSLKRVRAKQYSNIILGAKKLARYTGNDKFNILPRAHSAAWNSLDLMIRDYNDTMMAWEEFVSKI